MSCISWVRTREADVPTHLQGELQMEGFPFVVSDGLEHRLRTNLTHHCMGWIRTYHELVPDLDTLLQRTFPPCYLGNGSILELDIELGFVWVCPGYIRLLTVGNDGRLCLYVGHDGCERAVRCNCDLEGYAELSHYLISPTSLLHAGGVLRGGNKDARQVQIKSNILYFVPTTRLGKEGLQNVHL